MKQPAKPITRQLIHRYFGSDARVFGMGGWYRVTTPSGGVVRLGPGVRARLVFGGEDTYRALTLLLGDCWGSLQVRAHGTRMEVVLAHLAHGEAAGVDVQASFRNRGATFVRWCVFFGIVWVGVDADIDSTWSGAAALVLTAACVFGLLRRSARNLEQREAEQLGFHYPRVYGRSGPARRDDLERGGWL